jgi:hypothetical protein
VSDLWPRHYAAKILAAPTKEQRRELLNEVPEHLQNWVKKIVMNEFERRKVSSGRRSRSR